jgi:hypothetical protein
MGAYSPYLWQGLDGNTGRGMHGDIDGDYPGGFIQAAVELLDGQVATAHRVPGCLQEGSGFGKPERLTAEFIGIDQTDIHEHILQYKQWDMSVMQKIYYIANVVGKAAGFLHSSVFVLQCSISLRR